MPTLPCTYFAVASNTSSSYFVGLRRNTIFGKWDKNQLFSLCLPALLDKKLYGGSDSDQYVEYVGSPYDHDPVVNAGDKIDDTTDLHDDVSLDEALAITEQTYMTSSSNDTLLGNAGGIPPIGLPTVLPASSEEGTIDIQALSEFAYSGRKLTPRMYLWLTTLLAALSGFLFGYDIGTFLAHFLGHHEHHYNYFFRIRPSGVISGSSLSMKNAFQLTDKEEELFVAILLPGAIVG